MIGIDTNILVRHLVGDDAKQAKLVDIFFEKNCTADDPGYVNHIVLCELAWTLDRTYGYSRADIALALDNLLMARELKIENREIAAGALNVYRRINIGFSDALIAEANKSAGCLSTATLDRKAAKADGFTSIG
jgi:predicted nucleic-acid-binding protein